MPRRDMDYLDFKRMLFLGGRISNKEKLFQTLAKLGYEEADMYALLEFYKWFEKQPDFDVIKVAQKYFELFGMARLMPTLKELTRISMILGDTTDLRSYKNLKKKKKGNNHD